MAIEWSPRLLCKLLWLCCASTIPALAVAEPVCFRAAQAHDCLDSNATDKNACAELLRTDPYNLRVRFSVCEMHLREEEHLKAWLVLDQGVELCGRNRSACSRLRIARSNLEELSEKQSKDSSDTKLRELLAQQESKRRMCLNQRQLSSNLFINACEEALLTFRDQPELYISLAQKLLHRGEPARAVAALRRADHLSDDQALDKEINDAEQARLSLAEQCRDGSDLEVCNKALLAGEDDEFELQLKRSQLLREADNDGAALEALLIAQLIKPRDPATSRMLADLLPPGQLEDEPRLYAPRGQARFVLGDVTGAILDLRRGLELDLNVDETRSVLQEVRSQRATVVQSRCLDENSIDTCEELIIAGEPDEQIINNHVAEIREAQLAREKQARAAQEALALASKPPPAEPVPATPAPDTATPEDDGVGGDALAGSAPEQPVELLASNLVEADNPAVSEIIAEPRKEPRADSPVKPAPVLYSNKPKAGGVTY